MDALRFYTSRIKEVFSGVSFEFGFSPDDEDIPVLDVYDVPDVQINVFYSFKRALVIEAESLGLTYFCILPHSITNTIKHYPKHHCAG